MFGGSYNVGYFRFYDALFLGGNPRRILKFCDLLEKSKLDVSFRIDLRIGTTRNVLEKLRKVGCDVVGMGIESGSDKVLKRINKGITRELIDKSIKICRELGFWMMHACKFYTARIDCHLRISIKMR
ncbi:MAG: radical SAM protein [Candidatus Thermoplasmatota archaeon]|nr:radical SAM protein [Candidatus Thermoplasmatota archaeon]